MDSEAITALARSILDRRRRSLPSERLTLARKPASLSEAFVQGLRVDPAAREAGYADGAAGADWNPGPSHDVLDYSTGFFEGRKFGRKTETEGG